MALEIPPEFCDDLEPVAVADARTDDEIIQSLTHHVPVSSEKNVWAYWHAGVAAMPGWCRRNVAGWVRILGSAGWTVRVLDSVAGSANHALRFAPADLLPESFVRGSMTGPYTGPHSADFLRGALLYEHGGVNIDVGCILVRHLDAVCWDRLADESSPFSIAVPLMGGQTIANHFVAARRGDPFIKRWHLLFVHLWRGRSSHDGIIDDPLIAFAHDLKFDNFAEFGWDFSVPAKTVMEYIAQVMAWQRLCMLEGTEADPFDGSAYWQTHVFCFDVLQESWGGEVTVGFQGAGHKMYELLSVRLDADPESDAYRQAYQLVWRLLSRSTMQKITHGKGLTHSVHLGVLWDENPGRDAEPGTFAELLRYGAVHFRQKRASVVQVEAVKSPVTMKKGLLEA